MVKHRLQWMLEVCRDSFNIHYYNIESYDTIIKDLLDCYDKNNYTKWF